MPATLIRRTARLREAGPHCIGRGSRLVRRFSAVLAGANAVANPSFEMDLSGWTFSKTANRIAGGVDGAWCAQIAVADTEDDFTSDFNFASPPAAAEGESWSGKIWARGGSQVFRLSFWDAGFTSPTHHFLVATGQQIGPWAAYQFLAAVAPAATAFVFLGGYNQSATDLMAIDALSLVQEA